MCVCYVVEERIIQNRTNLSSTRITASAPGPEVYAGTQLNITKVVCV